LHRLPADVWIEKPVRFDGGFAVAQKRKRPVVLLEPARGFRGVIFGDSEDDGPLSFDGVERSLQLTELPLAVWSPTAAAEELENHELLALVIRELVGFTHGILKLEVRSRVTDLNSGLCEQRHG
jgi:hypothetical protein